MRHVRDKAVRRVRGRLGRGEQRERDDARGGEQRTQQRLDEQPLHGARHQPLQQCGLLLLGRQRQASLQRERLRDTSLPGGA